MTRRSRAFDHLWPIYLYGVRPRLYALHGLISAAGASIPQRFGDFLLRRPQPRDPRFTEADPVA